MRHQKSGYHLNRTRSHRKALLSNLSAALFERKRIKTTLAKAKATRSVAERYITFAKKGDRASRRRVLRDIPRKDIVKILFDEIAPMYAERQGGYSRIVKLGQRLGDGAPLAILELVGYESKVATKKKTTSKKAPKAGEKPEVAAADEEAEEVKEETKATKSRKRTKPAAKKSKPSVKEVKEAEEIKESEEASETEDTPEETAAEEIPEEPKEDTSEDKKE